MTKRFCDICGNEARENISAIEHKIEFGEKYNSYNNLHESLEQCYIGIRAIFVFKNNKSGFGGPPDLCTACALGLLDGLKNQIEKQQ